VRDGRSQLHSLFGRERQSVKALFGLLPEAADGPRRKLPSGSNETADVGEVLLSDSPLDADTLNEQGSVGDLASPVLFVTCFPAKKHIDVVGKSSTV